MLLLGRKNRKQGVSPLLLADSVGFIWRVVRSPKTPLRVKLLLGALGVYLVSPIDIISDAIPVLGYLDDILIVGGGIALISKWLPRQVVDELWKSDVPFVEAVGSLKAAAASLRPIKRLGRIRP